MSTERTADSNATLSLLLVSVNAGPMPRNELKAPRKARSRRDKPGSVAETESYENLLYSTTLVFGNWASTFALVKLLAMWIRRRTFSQLSVLSEIPRGLDSPVWTLSTGHTKSVRGAFLPERTPGSAASRLRKFGRKWKCLIRRMNTVGLCSFVTNS